MLLLLAQLAVVTWTRKESGVRLQYQCNVNNISVSVVELYLFKYSM